MPAPDGVRAQMRDTRAGPEKMPMERKVDDNKTDDDDVTRHGLACLPLLKCVRRDVLFLLVKLLVRLRYGLRR